MGKSLKKIVNYQLSIDNYRILVPLLFFFNTSFAHIADTLVKAESKEFLEMKGIVKKSKTSAETEISFLLDSVEISVYSTDNLPVETIFTNKKGKCEFKLPLNKQFSIKISKKGFVSKFIEVNTKVPADKKVQHLFTFQVDIFEEIEGLDVSMLNNPIAKVTFSTNEGKFVYDMQYTNRINTDLKKIYQNYYFLKKIEADSLNNPKQN